jgi:lysophospholipase L1-like esterase
MRNRPMLMVTALLALGAVVPTAHASTSYREYVALGDSWSADVFTHTPPTTKYTPVDCAQSDTDYPHQVAAALHVSTFRDATCGSATTVEMTHPQALPAGGVNPPQFNRLTKTTNLVTLGIGGNDIGLAGDVEACLSPTPVPVPGVPLAEGCKAKLAPAGHDSVEKAIAATAPKISAVITQIRKRSPQARILLVNYLNGLPITGKGCWPTVPIQDNDMAYLQQKFLHMNAMIARVARSQRITLVDTYMHTIGHDVCKAPTVRFIEGVIPVSAQSPTLVNFPFHPNQAGADAQSRTVLSALR